MKLLDSNLWIVNASQQFLGLELGTRMTVVRLPDSTLWLHSPVAATSGLVRQVEEQGKPAHLVAPNRFHHLFVSSWKQHFPDACVYVAPGLAAKRSDLVIARVLGVKPEAVWSEAIEQIFLKGLPLANETVFFHRPSSTLIASDLAFNIGSEKPFSTRLAFRLGGAYGRLSPTRLEKLMVRDRLAFRSSLQAILEWPFERVIMAHGEVVEKNGKEKLASGYAWLLNRN